MRFLELAHVDGDDVLFAAVERLGQRQGGFGLAHPGRAGQHEHADGLVGIVQRGARGLNPSSDHVQRVPLADDAAVEDVGQTQYGFDLVLDHAPDRDAGPVGDHRSHGLRIHAGQDQRRLALQFVQLGLKLLQFH